MCALIHIIFFLSMFLILSFFATTFVLHSAPYMGWWVQECGCWVQAATREKEWQRETMRNNIYYLSGGHLQENTHSALTSCMKGERMGAGARTSCCLRFWKITLDYSSPWHFYHLLVVMHFCQLSATHILQYTCTLAYICSFSCG